MTSIIMAKAFGLYLVIIAIAMLLGGKRFVNQALSMLSEPGLALFSAVITLFLGAFLVAIHNIWVTDWPVIITVLCWLTLIKGAIRVLVPHWDIPISRFYAEHHGFVTGSAVFTLLLGLYLCYLGFITT